MNIRKHWKRLLLTTTALFWASCTSENENTFPTIAQDTPHAVDPSASSDSHIESSSEKAVESSSSDAVASSSSEAKVPSSSSELTQVMPAYGVYDKVSCYLDDEDKGIKASTSSRGVFEDSYHCENGVNCVARDSVTGYEPEYPCKEDSITKQMICLDYGVIATTETTFSCDDGKTYSEEEFRKQYNRLYTIKNNQDESSSSVAESSSSTEQSSSSAVTCSPNLDKFFSVSKADRYSIDNAAPDASSQAKFDANRKITAIRDSLSKDTPKCLKDMQEDLERNFVAVYGAPYANRLPAEETCSDGTTRPTKEYLEQQKFDEEQAKKKPQYDEKYNEVYKEETKKLDKKINDCLNLEKTEE